jgi:hypothetical protein
MACSPTPHQSPPRRGHHRSLTQPCPSIPMPLAWPSTPRPGTSGPRAPGAPPRRQASPEPAGVPQNDGDSATTWKEHSARNHTADTPARSSRAHQHSRYAPGRHNVAGGATHDDTHRRAPHSHPRGPGHRTRGHHARRGPGPGRPPHPTSDPQDGGVESRTPRRAQSATPRRTAPNGQQRPPQGRGPPLTPPSSPPNTRTAPGARPRLPNGRVAPSRASARPPPEGEPHGRPTSRRSRRRKRSSTPPPSPWPRTSDTRPPR